MTESNDPTQAFPPAASYYQPPQLPIQPTRKPAKRWRTRSLLLISGATGVACILIGVGIGGAGTADANLAAPAPEVTITQQIPGLPIPGPVTTVTVAPPKPAAPAAKPKPAKATIPDGESVVVGSDVPAGKYDAHSTDGTCYWEIDKHATSNIIDNDLGKQGHIVITLKKGEDFSSERCGDWTQE